VASKSAALIVLARLVQFLLSSMAPGLRDFVILALAIVAIVTMTLANLSAYWQTSVKRLLAYSSVAHAGYITCGVLVFSDSLGIAAIVAYVLVYLLMNLGAFTVAGLVEAQTGSDHLDQFTGLGTRNPRLAAAMALFLFSLVGLPPLAGFAAKWILLSALWQGRLAFVAVAVLINTLFSLFYYLRIARAMYFRSSPSSVPSGQSVAPGQPTAADPPLVTIEVPGPAGLVLTACAVGLLGLFLGWGLLNHFSLSLFAVAH
ncbi:MAG: hypothetical protein MUC88_28265, partial [Planctomycetes bacterium]|jgi:NADH-quinone oxidoreductase subunit N|nr:hypothetical protein [Planctomycetota bacterium]